MVVVILVTSIPVTVHVVEAAGNGDDEVSEPSEGLWFSRNGDLNFKTNDGKACPTCIKYKTVSIILRMVPRDESSSIKGPTCTAPESSPMEGDCTPLLGEEDKDYVRIDFCKGPNDPEACGFTETSVIPDRNNSSRIITTYTMQADVINAKFQVSSMKDIQEDDNLYASAIFTHVTKWCMFNQTVLAN